VSKREGERGPAMKDRIAAQLAGEEDAAHRFDIGLCDVIVPGGA